MRKSSGVVFDEINAKIADSADVAGAYMISKLPFTPKSSITFPMLPRKLINSWNTECTVTRNILQLDLMHWDQQLEEVLCEIFLNMLQWLLIAYNRLPIVCHGYGKNKQYAIISQDLTSKSFQESILNQSL